jgi:hypothetical protein
LASLGWFLSPTTSSHVFRRLP